MRTPNKKLETAQKPRHHFDGLGLVVALIGSGHDRGGVAGVKTLVELLPPSEGIGGELPGEPAELRSIDRRTVLPATVTLDERFELGEPISPAVRHGLAGYERAIARRIGTIGGAGCV